ncbi:energy coupling factor transporter S component ThiW [Salinicoccus halodurans]|uniref:Energy coupling factor transporter S component ThiW n=1 Tax=Salinicoccus halodurans TaxID=407035 RepID=A0A0F7D490_9STAP|nr:energy coupling factor transporter S component ThiW [Salinicoccus halodurans]AKG73820.1 thiamine biosynthesis protein ThiW [Salinicoccus halodurans]SFK56384.1 energy coupling factor transporter S component ThiW [Salinicoccus halodurans]
MTRKLTLTAVFTALNVVLSMFIIIPLGPVRAAPMQHLINVMSVVFTGPWGIVQAFLSSTIRILLGTGSPFAYPGSMIGALLAWLLYRKFKKLSMGAIGEVIGTGVFGSIATLPLIMVLGLDAGFFYVLAPAFIASSLIGALVSWVMLRQLERKGVLDRFNNQRRP